MVNQSSLNELALFAGAGGGILGGKLLGWRTVCAVEWEAYPASVLCARQNDGLLPPFPIWDDVQTFDGHPWRGVVDVVSGGFPCQDISAAGRGAGIDGERSGMWREMARIIREVRPRYAFVENSPMLTSRGLGVVLADLASMGFDARWGVLGAADVGANHQRDRIWIVGKATNPNRIGLQKPADQQELEGKGSNQLQTIKPRNQSEVANTCSKRREFDKLIRDVDGWQVRRSIGEQGENGSKQYMDNTTSKRLEGSNDNSKTPKWFQQKSSERCAEIPNTTSIGLQRQGQYEQSVNQTQGRKRQTTELVYGRSPDFWAIEPNVGRVADGVAARVDRLKAIGNGQVPLCAATAFRILSQDL